MDHSLNKLELAKKWFAGNSLSRLFSIVLTLIVTIVILFFSIIAAFYNNAKMEMSLQKKLGKTLKSVETSLTSSVWQLDYASMNDILNEIFTDETITYANITSGDEILVKKIHIDCQWQFRGIHFYK